MLSALGFIPILYVVVSEIIQKKANALVLGSYFFLSLICLFLSSYFDYGIERDGLNRGGMMLTALANIFIALIASLPFKNFFKEDRTFWFVLPSISLWVSLQDFICFYFYMSLVCALLALYSLVKNQKVSEWRKVVRWWVAKKKEERSDAVGVVIPFYTAVLFGYLWMYLLQEGKS